MVAALRLDDVADSARPQAEPEATPPTGRLRRHGLRITCHLAAELPLVVLCIRSLTTGWRATSDDAVVAWRAWDVLSAHPTLLGAPTHATGVDHQVFAPGPALSWLLTVPVHVDPTQGTLWGSTLIALAAVALTVEAGWAGGGRFGAVGASLSVVVVLTTETAVLMNLPWTPWQGALWLLAAMGCAWATAGGRLWWWPAGVLAACIAAQAHVVFALTAVTVCGAGLVVGVLGIRRARRADDGLSDAPDEPGHRRPRVAVGPLMTGLVVGVVLWLPPLLDELWGSPGNLTLLWRSSSSARGTIGYSGALQGLGAATWPPFSWTHRLPTTGPALFFQVLGTTFHGPAWHGVVTLVVLLALALWCTVTRRTAVAALCWVATVASAAAVVTIAQTPSANAFQLVYLGVLFWPVGLLATGTVVAGIVAIVRSLADGRIAASTGRLIATGALAVGVVGVVGLAAGVTEVDARSVPNELSVQGGPDVALLATRAAAAVSRVAPDGPFELRLTGSATVANDATAYPSIAYALISAGRPVRLPELYAVGADASRAAHGRLPVVTVDIGSTEPTARLTSS